MIGNLRGGSPAFERVKALGLTLSGVEANRRYPLVLVRLSRIDRDALRDVLAMSWRLTLPKAKPARRRR
jgi:hypothetical protein